MTSKLYEVGVKPSKRDTQISLKGFSDFYENKEIIDLIIFLEGQLDRVCSGPSESLRINASSGNSYAYDRYRFELDGIELKWKKIRASQPDWWDEDGRRQLELSIIHLSQNLNWDGNTSGSLIALLYGAVKGYTIPLKSLISKLLILHTVEAQTRYARERDELIMHCWWTLDKAEILDPPNKPTWLLIGLLRLLSTSEKEVPNRIHARIERFTSHFERERKSSTPFITVGFWHLYVSSIAIRWKGLKKKLDTVPQQGMQIFTLDETESRIRDIKTEWVERVNTLTALIIEKNLFGREEQAICNFTFLREGSSNYEDDDLDQESEEGDELYFIEESGYRLLMPNTSPLWPIFFKLVSEAEISEPVSYKFPTGSENWAYGEIREVTSSIETLLAHLCLSVGEQSEDETDSRYKEAILKLVLYRVESERFNFNKIEEIEAWYCNEVHFAEMFASQVKEKLSCILQEEFPSLNEEVQSLIRLNEKLRFAGYRYFVQSGFKGFRLFFRRWNSESISAYLEQRPNGLKWLLNIVPLLAYAEAHRLSRRNFIALLDWVIKNFSYEDIRRCGARPLKEALESIVGYEIDLFYSIDHLLISRTHIELPGEETHIIESYFRNFFFEWSIRPSEECRELLTKEFRGVITDALKDTKSPEEHFLLWLTAIDAP